MSHSPEPPVGSRSTMPKSEGGENTEVTDVRLTDVRLAAEIELLGQVIAVVAEHEGPLSAEEVDAVLGATDTAKDPEKDPDSDPDSY
jgi:hypothetical protein